MINLINGDCLEMLITIKPISVNMVLTNPPDMLKSDFNFMPGGAEKRMFKECYRILKDDSFLIFNGNYDNGLRWKKICESIGFSFHFCYIWKAVYEKRDFWKNFSNTEYIWIFTKRNPITEKDIVTKSHRTRAEDFEAILKMYTHKDDVILDPFMGISDTGVECAKKGLSFIGIEKNEQLFKEAKTKISFHNSKEFFILTRDEMESLNSGKYYFHRIKENCKKLAETTYICLKKAGGYCDECKIGKITPDTMEICLAGLPTYYKQK